MMEYTAERGSIYKSEAESFFYWLEQNRERAVYMRVRDLIGLLLAESGFKREVECMPGGDIRGANLELLMEKAADYENSSYHGLFSFVRYIEQMKEKKIDYGEASVTDENADVVKLMTIHKSKGLEFPVCIVLGLARGFNRRDAGGSCICDMKYGFALDAIDSVRRTRTDGLKKKVLAGCIKDDSTAEEMRVLYVALTRAREKLIITAPVKRLPEEGREVKLDMLSIKRAASPLAWILDAVTAAGKYSRYVHVMSAEKLTEGLSQEAEAEAVSGAALYEGRIEPDAELLKLFSEGKERVYSHPELAGLYTKTSVSELKKAAYEDEEAIAFVSAPGGKTEAGGAERGTAYHRFMELLDHKSLPDGREQAAAFLAAEFKRMRDGGRLSEEAAALIKLEDMEDAVCGEMAERMKAAARAGLLYKEQPFFMGVPAARLKESFPEDETILIQGVIDAYWEEEGELVLLDYKTDRVRSAEELTGRYAKQLEIYSDALVQLTSKKVAQKLIYSFALGRLIVL